MTTAYLAGSRWLIQTWKYTVNLRSPVLPHWYFHFSCSGLIHSHLFVRSMMRTSFKDNSWTFILNTADQITNSRIDFTYILHIFTYMYIYFTYIFTYFYIYVSHIFTLQAFCMMIFFKMSIWSIWRVAQSSRALLISSNIGVSQS